MVTGSLIASEALHEGPVISPAFPPGPEHVAPALVRFVLSFLVDDFGTGWLCLSHRTRLPIYPVARAIARTRIPRDFDAGAPPLGGLGSFLANIPALMRWDNLPCASGAAIPDPTELMRRLDVIALIQW